MKIDSYNKKIASLIVIFPPIILIIYAVVAYMIFNYSDKKNDDNIISFYKNEVTHFSANTLKVKVYSLDKLINYHKNDINSVISFLKGIKLRDNSHIIILNKNGAIVYSSESKDKIPLNILKKVNGFYEDSNYIIVSKVNESSKYKILAYTNKDFVKHSLKYIEKELNNSRNNGLVSTIFWLVLVWFILLFISLWLSTSVYKRLKKYEKSIDNANKDIIFESRQAMLGELLPMIAHQWRQPLNKISSVLMRMRFEIMSGKTNTQTLDRQSQLIEDSVELMSQTIDDFRTFYRPKEEPQEVDLAMLVRKAGYFLDELLKRKKIKLHQELASVHLRIHANEFLQVIINLIKNASDAVAVRGEIDIFLREFDDGRVELRIEDNGTGIPKDKLEKIFEAHESSKQSSMGLGLYMSKLIIEERFGGKIKAYNTPRGAGFLIILFKGGGRK